MQARALPAVAARTPGVPGAPAGPGGALFSSGATPEPRARATPLGACLSMHIVSPPVEPLVLGALGLGGLHILLTRERRNNPFKDAIIIPCRHTGTWRSRCVDA